MSDDLLHSEFIRVIRTAVREMGHDPCNGWWYMPEWKLVRCQCGEDLLTQEAVQTLRGQL